MQHTFVDMVWVLVCGILVFIMQAGFMCLEVGLIRQKNNINVAIKNMTDFMISSVIFYLMGFAVMFGTSYKGWMGTDGWLLLKYIRLDQNGWLHVFFFFQLVFCGAAATIVSGGVAERMRFVGYMLVTVLISGLIYPVFGHWVWGGAFDMAPAQGWLAALGYKDFAGSSVVHMVGGVTTLACLMVLGPRKGKYNSDGSANKIWGSNLPIATLGVLLLWLGWFGFNGGSTFGANKSIGLIIVNTVLAACAGSLSSLFFARILKKHLEVESVLNGCLGGLVAITATCRFVSPASALLIGFLAGPVLVFTEYLLDRFRIDDAVGAIPVHGACGVLGVLCVGFFAEPEFLIGNSRIHQIGIQFLGVAVCFFYTFFVAWTGVTIIDKWILRLRVPPDDEEKGLNISEHGARTLWFDLAQEINIIEKSENLSGRVTVASETETGLVASVFNRLMASLQKKTEELKTTQRKAAQSEKLAAVGQLASGVAHEVNNPIAVILGFSQGVLQKLRHGDPMELPLKSIEREALRCKRLVQDLLTFSRADKNQSKFEPIDANEAIEGCLSLIGAQARAKAVTFEKHFSGDLPKMTADRGQVQQIIINLANNAIDAMPDGGKLLITTQLSQNNGHPFVQIHVQDTGQGIPPEIQKRIFDPFFTTKEVGKGTGLGLSLVYEIVKKHNGEIQVDSHPGKGTAFDIFLPAAA